MAYENHPILAKDRLDYVDGSYDTGVKPGLKGTGMSVRHEVCGRNLVENLLQRSMATFAVEVASPYATYRQIRMAEAGCGTTLTQEVSWEADDVVAPVYLRPLVVAKVAAPISIKLNGEHGVHEVWQGIEVSVEPGMILAQDQFWRGASTWESLIRLVSNEKVADGGYRVESNTGEGFHFDVQMHPELFTRMVNPGDAINHRDSILTGCLARGLELIRAQYGEGDAWREFPVLRALHAKLEENGLETWEDNESFRADEVACWLRPIIFGVDGDE